MSFLEVNSHPTWLFVGEENGPLVLLLHGGMSDSELMLHSVGEHLAGDYTLAAFDRRGHGRTADTDEAFHYDSMVDETVAVLEHLGRRASLVGWSDGGIVALLVALHRPDLLERIVVIGANYHHEGTRPLNIGADSPFVSVLASRYAERSPDGEAHFGEFVAKTFMLWGSEPTMSTGDLAAITVPVLVMAADDDSIDPAHTNSLFESIPLAELAVVPGASHLLPIEQPGEVARIVTRFLSEKLPRETLGHSRR
jgi:pimeloyl-ACP methyl ester carboxylesterase